MPQANNSKIPGNISRETMEKISDFLETPCKDEAKNVDMAPAPKSELDQMLDGLANDRNMVVDGTTAEERDITAEDIAGMAKDIMTDEEFDGRILSERAINKFARQQREAKEKEQKVFDFLTWYYKYQQDQYFQKYRYCMSGPEKRKLRKKIARDWDKGKLKKLYESNIN